MNTSLHSKYLWASPCCVNMLYNCEHLFGTWTYLRWTIKWDVFKQVGMWSSHALLNIFLTCKTLTASSLWWTYKVWIRWDNTVFPYGKSYSCVPMMFTWSISICMSLKMCPKMLRATEGAQTLTYAATMTYCNPVHTLMQRWRHWSYWSVFGWTIPAWFHRLLRYGLH